jgi:hypothetical protein
MWKNGLCPKTIGLISHELSKNLKGYMAVKFYNILEFSVHALLSLENVG